MREKEGDEELERERESAVGWREKKRKRDKEGEKIDRQIDRQRESVGGWRNRKREREKEGEKYRQKEGEKGRVGGREEERKREKYISRNDSCMVLIQEHV